jgi:hypothetical protein
VLRHGDDPVLASPHGIFGFAIAALAIVQVTPSLIVRNRLQIRSLHLVVGYSLVALIALQTLSGIAMALHHSGFGD